MSIKYYLCTDFGTGWLSGIYKKVTEYNVLTEVEEETKDCEYLDLPQSTLSTEFVSNLFCRESFDQTIRIFRQSGSWLAVSISEYEYNRVKKLIELNKYVVEFNKLGSL